MKSYLKFLSRNKLYTAVEAVGLGVSLAFVILIGSYVRQQYGITRENPDADRIYCLGTPDMLALSFWDKESLESQVPEIEAISRFGASEESIATFNGSPWWVSSCDVDPGFFDLFPYYRILEGSLDGFAEGSGALVSRSFAARIRKGEESLIGMPLKLDDDDYVICGIVEDFRNTLFPYHDIVVSSANSLYNKAGITPFHSLGSHLTFFRRQSGTDETAFKEKVLEICRKNYAGIMNETTVYPLKEIFFHPHNWLLNKGNLTMLRLLTVVVLLLLLSAIFNYVNLNMALVGKRAKEMATRRLLGAQKREIIGKYIAESILFTTVAFGFAVLIAYACVPMMNRLLASSEPSRDIALRFLANPAYLAAYAAGIFLLGSLSGLIPAMMASKFQPIDVIRGSFRRFNKQILSKVFIVIQNVLAVVLISLAVVMEAQMRHMVNRPVHATTRDRYLLHTGARTVAQIQPLADRLRALPCVEEIGFGRGLPGDLGMRFGQRISEDKEVNVSLLICDSTYFRMLGFEQTQDFGHPYANSVWLGETAFRAAEVSDTSASFARGFHMNHSRAEYIGGTLRDFPAESAASSDGETNPNVGVIVQRPEALVYSCDILLRTTGDHAEAERQIVDLYKAFLIEQDGVSREPERSGYVDDLLLQKLEPAKRTMRLLELFMALAVLIALLGLVAMSTYFSDERTKDLAVRKVFGGTVGTETRRSVREYLILTLAACCIGIPVAVRAAGKYLERFSWRISGYGWMFAAAAILTLGISFASVLRQTLQAARTNPAEELKKE